MASHLDTQPDKEDGGEEAETQGTLQLGLEQNGCTSREKEDIEDEIRSKGTKY